jgi:hypothetical protein
MEHVFCLNDELFALAVWLLQRKDFIRGDEINRNIFVSLIFVYFEVIVLGSVDFLLAED